MRMPEILKSRKFTIFIYSLAVIMFLVLITKPANAQGQQFAKFPLDPSYMEDIKDSGAVSFVLAMDNINASKFVSVELHFVATQKADTYYFVTVDSVACDAPRFFSEGTGQKEVRVDCTSRIPTIGKYTIELTQVNSLAVPLTAIYGWVEVTYYPTEKESDNILRKEIINYFKTTYPNIAVHGTEYSPNEDGKVFVQVLSGNQPVANASCELKMFYPNNTVFVSSPMTYVTTSQSLYDYDFTVPSTLGVYMTEVFCATPVQSRNETFFFRQIGINEFLNTTAGTSLATQTLNAISGTNFFCYTPIWQETSDTGINIVNLKNVTRTKLWLSSTANRNIDVYMNISKKNVDTLQTAFIGQATRNIDLLTDVQTLVELSNLTNLNVSMTSSERIIAQICVRNNGGSQSFTFYYNSATRNSSFFTQAGAFNLSEAVSYRGSGEVHVSTASGTSSVVVNTTNTTVVVNTTNTTVIVNVTNTTFSPTIVSNITLENNVTVQNNLTVTLVDNSTHQINTTVNTTVIINDTSFSNNLTNVLDRLTVLNNTVNQIQVNLTTIQTIVTDIQSTVNSILTFVTSILTQVQLIFNQTSEINSTLNSLNVSPEVTVNLTVNTTTQVVSVQNQTVNVVVNTTNVTVNDVTAIFNVTNTTVSVNNITSIINVTNVTVVTTNPIFNITNITFVDNNTFTTVVVNVTNVTTVTDLTNITNILNEINGTVFDINLSLVPNTILIY